jgi:hypothetical protein
MLRFHFSYTFDLALANLEGVELIVKANDSTALTRYFEG